MKNKIILSILIIIGSYCIVGCGDTKMIKTEQQKTESPEPEKFETNNQFGDLKYFIPEPLNEGNNTADHVRTYKINNESTNITIYIFKLSEITESIENYMENDAWHPIVTEMEKDIYNNHEWYVQRNGLFLMYTKYKNTVYKIRFNVIKDDINLASELRKIIPKSLTFV